MNAWLMRNKRTAPSQANNSQNNNNLFLNIELYRPPARWNDWTKTPHSIIEQDYMLNLTFKYNETIIIKLDLKY